MHTDRSAAEPKQRLADKICTGARLEAVRSLSLHTLLFGFFPQKAWDPVGGNNAGERAGSTEASFCRPPVSLSPDTS